MKNNLKILLMLLCVLAILVAVPACQKDDKNPDAIKPPSSDTTTSDTGDQKVVLSLNETSIVIGIDETKKLSAKSSVTNMETSGVLWESDNPSVATVDTSGNVKGISEGTAFIFATTIDGSSRAECAVTVASKVTGINIKETEITLEVGKTNDLNYEIIPQNITNVKVIWSSNNEDVATVSENGIITAIADGSASIRVETEDGISDSCVVHVITPVKSIKFDQSSWYLAKGVGFDLKGKYTITPANATDKTVTWSTDNERVAIVSSDGRVTPMGAGTATITVTASNGMSAQCLVNVTASVSGVTISQQKLELIKGDEWELSAQVLPEDASNKKVTWKTSDATIATVSQSGIVTARKTGEVVISVVTADGNLSAQCEVTVINPLQSIVLDKVSVTLSIHDQPLTLVPTFEPLDAENIADAKWSSSNPRVATVDENGVVTAVAPGTADITIATSNGIHATCTVVVPETSKVPVSSITVGTGYVVLKPGEKHTPVVTVLPEDAGDKTYILISSNTAVVKVNGDGSIIAISKGTVTITVTSVQNPQIREEFFVKVEELTQDEIDSSIVKYNNALAQENNRYLAALGQIDLKYAYLADMKKDMDSYVAQKAEIEKNLNDYRVALSDAENANNAELIKHYTDLIAQEESNLTKLESDYVNYPEMLEMYNEKSVEYQAEKDAENKLNADNIAKIKSEYEFIQKYLPTT